MRFKINLKICQTTQRILLILTLREFAVLYTRKKIQIEYKQSQQRKQSVLVATRSKSSLLAKVGSGGVSYTKRNKQTYHCQYWLLQLPLVSCDGRGNF